MATDLDLAYQALKRTEPHPRSESPVGDRKEVIDALAVYFASCVYKRAKGATEYVALHNELAPKALVMIATVVDLFRDMADGTNAGVDAFIGEITKHGKA